MTKSINNIIISSIRRSPNNTATSTTRASELNIDTLSEKTISQLTNLFVGGGMKAGCFNGEPTPSNFKRIVNNHITNDQDNIELSNFRNLAHQLSELLAKTLNEAQAQNAKDGFLITYFYTHNSGSDDKAILIPYLCSAFFHRVDGVDINNDELDFEEIERINLDNLTLGARITLDALNSPDNERPITFKIGGRTDVSKFFLRFLGCDEPENSTEDTKRLREAIESFGEDNGYDKEGIESLCDRAKAFCKERIKEADGRIDIRDLAGSIFTNSDHINLFIEHAHDVCRLSDTFLVNPREISKFTNLYVKTNDFTLQFKTKSLSTNVDWDSVNKTLTFKNLPEKAIEQILLYLPNEDISEDN